MQRATRWLALVWLTMALCSTLRIPGCANLCQAPPFTGVTLLMLPLLLITGASALTDVWRTYSVHRRQSLPAQLGLMGRCFGLGLLLWGLFLNSSAAFNPSGELTLSEGEGASLQGMPLSTSSRDDTWVHLDEVVYQADGPAHLPCLEAHLSISTQGQKEKLSLSLNSPGRAQGRTFYLKDVRWQATKLKYFQNKQNGTEQLSALSLSLPVPDWNLPQPSRPLLQVDGDSAPVYFAVQAFVPDIQNPHSPGSMPLQPGLLVQEISAKDLAREPSCSENSPACLLTASQALQDNRGGRLVLEKNLYSVTVSYQVQRGNSWVIAGMLLLTIGLLTLLYAPSPPKEELTSPAA